MRRFKYIEKEIAIFEKLKSTYDYKLISCTKAEVNELESMLPDSYHLPLAYKEFLLYGGHDMGGLFDSVDFSYGMAKILLKNKYQSIYDMVQFEEEPGWKLPENIFVINDHPSANFTYFWLTEGENPPVYWWEEDEGGLEEASKKDADSFSDFLMKMIEKDAIFSAHRLTSNQTEADKPPRGKQFWIPKESEYSQGAEKHELMDRLGFYGRNMYLALEITGLDIYSYLEELSGWKALKIEDEIRFFPPSYESPEEKEKKILEQQKQLESKKQELLLVEKRITNYQSRIKNLSGSKLTGSSVNNSSALQLKELKRDLQKQNLLKQKLERQITELENKIN